MQRSPPAVTDARWRRHGARDDRGGGASRGDPGRTGLEPGIGGAVQAVLAYYGAGATWLAVPVGEGAPAGQLSAVQDVAAALGGSLHHGAAGA